MDKRWWGEEDVGVEGHNPSTGMGKFDFSPFQQTFVLLAFVNLAVPVSLCIRRRVQPEHLHWINWMRV